MKQFKQSINLLKLSSKHFNITTTSNNLLFKHHNILLPSSFKVNNFHYSFIQLNNNTPPINNNNTSNTTNTPPSTQQKFVISEDVETTTNNNTSTTTTNSEQSLKNQQRVRIINSSSSSSNNNNNSSSNNSSSSNSKFTKTIKYSIIFTIASVVIYIIVESNNDRMNYYVSPSKVMDNRQDFPPDRKIRIGGIVKEGTIQHGENNFLTLFKITDLKYDIEIEYKGVLPDLFEENSTAICEGFMISHSKLKCTNILAKHDQRNGMPPEIAYEVEKNRREMERRKLNEENLQEK